MITINDAILELKPNAIFQVRLSVVHTIDDFDNIEWGLTEAGEVYSDIPTKAEVNTKWVAMKTRDNHIVPRIEAYPTVEKQMDMQYEDAVNGTTTWKDAIAQVKTDNPKA